MTSSASSVTQDRQKPLYRLLESSLAISSILFLSFYIILAIFWPQLAAIFMIIYSFLWTLKFALSVIYTLYTYKQLRRWSQVNWPSLFASFRSQDLFLEEKGGDKSELIAQTIEELKEKYPNKIDWQEKLDQDLAQLKTLEGGKFADFNNIFHAAMLCTYNEPPAVVLRSILGLKASGYAPERLVVFISQEERAGQKHNDSVWEELQKQEDLEVYNLSEKDLEIVYTDKHETLAYENAQMAAISPGKEGKLTVILTQHPDGLVGEIKGNASNEDWVGRQISLFVKAQKIDPELVLLTTLDADSRVGRYFFHQLTYRFCLTPDRLQAGFEPTHVYSNNFFETGVWPRLVATQTTFYNLANLGTPEEAMFFAVYSVPLTVLQKVNFWVRDIIAEDAMLFLKCFCHFQGQFRVVGFYGLFEGDAVEDEDYLEEIISQYKQLQRWAWGGVEQFPYILKKFFWEKNGQQIDLRLRLKWTYLLFSNPIFWTTTPLLFAFGPLLPGLFHGESFQSQPLAQNLLLFSQAFAWISFIFIFSLAYLTVNFVGRRAAKGQIKFSQLLLILIQFLISPFVCGIMGIPALDAQLRGLFGKYLGYWVTPKK